MSRWLVAVACVLTFATSAAAHFVFVVPDASSRSALVILSEDLVPDEDVPIATIAGARLEAEYADGRRASLALAPGGAAAFAVTLGSDVRVVRGAADLGVVRRGKSKPEWLAYYPKAVLGDPFVTTISTTGTPVPVELVPVGSAGALRLRLLAAGAVVPDAEVAVIMPGGEERRVRTDSSGDTPALEASGRYGAWARHVRAVAGERDGARYEEIRQYATLVIDVAAPTTPVASRASWPSLPESVSSFGAVACDGWLYVYGGHTADTHTYARGAVTGRFHRLRLEGGVSWEELPAGPPLQGMNLAAWRGRIYRAGGMAPVNEPGAKPDLRSVSTCAVYDPAARLWTPLPPLPDPRSSHDIVVLGDTLYVTGGWDLTGAPDAARWLDTMLALDLASQTPSWREVPQPVRRRAFTAAAARGKLYALGGLGSALKPDRRVDVYDPATGAWTSGPELPGLSRNAFGAAAATLDGQLYVSVADGGLYRLDRAGTAWEPIAEATPRIVHRLIPHERELLIVGGADGDEQLGLIEAVVVPRS